VAIVARGAPGLLTVTADTGAANLPVSVTLCETDPVTSLCLAPPTPAVQTPNATSATPTYRFFVHADVPIPFAPGTNRVQVHFENGGGTSVAVCSVPLCPPRGEHGTPPASR
jgi:hypothetical protein